MFDMSVPGWELLARGVLVYVGVLIMVRLSGKRTIGEFSPFDVIVLLLLAEAAGGSLRGSDESVQGGLLVVATLILLNYVVAFISTRSKAVDALLEGQPVVLIRDGRIDRKAMLRNNVPEGDIDEAMRGCSIREREDVELAILEPGGAISFFKREGGTS